MHLCLVSWGCAWGDPPQPVPHLRPRQPEEFPAEKELPGEEHRGFPFDVCREDVFGFLSKTGLPVFGKCCGTPQQGWEPRQSPAHGASRRLLQWVIPTGSSARWDYVFPCRCTAVGCSTGSSTAQTGAGEEVREQPGGAEASSRFKVAFVHKLEWGELKQKQ